MASIESWWKDLSNDISADVGVQNLTPNHPFPLQSTDDAASISFWSLSPRNSYRPQFGSASPITIPLIHSWYGPLVGIVSTFTFEQIVHNWHQFDCIVTSHCTRTTFCKMTTSDDNIKWFHQHVSSTYNLLETAVPMADVAMYTIKHIKRLTLTHFSNKVKSDFFRILVDYSQAKGTLIAFYLEPITTCLLELIDDDWFNQDAFLAYHLSMPIVVPEQSSPVANLLEQGTPLTNNLSEHAKKDLSRQLQRIHVEHSENIPKHLNRLLLMRKVYIKNWLLLLPILPWLHLWTLK